MIIGATDSSLDIEFWTKDENPNWKLAGIYKKLRARQAAYLKLEELENSFENLNEGISLLGEVVDEVGVEEI